MHTHRCTANLIVLNDAYELVVLRATLAIWETNHNIMLIFSRLTIMRQFKVSPLYAAFWLSGRAISFVTFYSVLLVSKHFYHNKEDTIPYSKKATVVKGSCANTISNTYLQTMPEWWAKHKSHGNEFWSFLFPIQIFKSTSKLCRGEKSHYYLSSEVSEDPIGCKKQASQALAAFPSKFCLSFGMLLDF